MDFNKMKIAFTKPALCLLLFLAVQACEIFEKQESQIIKEYPNPENSLKVLIFEKTGNATVGNSIHASLEHWDYDLKNDALGNVFIADKPEGVNTSKDSLIIVNWIDNLNVEFIYSEKLSVYKKENRVEKNGSLKIQFKELDLTRIPDSLELIPGKNLSGDFNGDHMPDLAALVKNKYNQKTGVLILHNQDDPMSFVFGAGKEINGMSDLEWVQVFKSLPKGQLISPNLVDEETGDILGQDESRQFELIGNGIFLGVEETHGGGIIFWNAREYEWLHME